jgi:hypothetical protein
MNFDWGIGMERIRKSNKKILDSKKGRYFVFGLLLTENEY